MDDDGAGYMDIGEEDDWGAEAEAEDTAQDSHPSKKQKAGDGKKGRPHKHIILGLHSIRRHLQWDKWVARTRNDVNQVSGNVASKVNSLLREPPGSQPWLGMHLHSTAVFSLMHADAVEWQEEGPYRVLGVVITIIERPKNGSKIFSAEC